MVVKPLDSIFTKEHLMYTQVWVSLQYLIYLDSTSIISEPVLKYHREKKTNVFKTVLEDRDWIGQITSQLRHKEEDDFTKPIQDLLSQTLQLRSPQVVNLGLTDRNLYSLAYSLMFNNAKFLVEDLLQVLEVSLSSWINETQDHVLTHGRAPLLIGREMNNYRDRIQYYRLKIKDLRFKASAAGQLGSFCELYSTNGGFDHEELQDGFIRGVLGLDTIQYSAVQPHGDTWAEFLRYVEGVALVLSDLGEFLKYLSTRELITGSSEVKSGNLAQRAIIDLTQVTTYHGNFIPRGSLGSMLYGTVNTSLLESFKHQMSYFSKGCHSILDFLNGFKCSKPSVPDLSSLILIPLEVYVRINNVPNGVGQLNQFRQTNPAWPSKDSVAVLIDSLKIPAEEKARFKRMKPLEVLKTGQRFISGS